MTGNVENANGIIAVDTEVISQFAGHAALDCFGIVGMAISTPVIGACKALFLFFDDKYHILNYNK